MSALAFPVLLHFDPEAHVYSIAGRQVPNVTLILEDLAIIDYSRIPPSIREAALERGNDVHHALAYWLQGDYEEGSLAPEYLGFFEAAQRFAADMELVVEPEDVEKRVYIERPEYCGTLDLEGTLTVPRIGTRRCLIDWKTGTAEPWVRLQTAAYARGFEHPATRYRVCVELHQDGNVPSVLDAARDIHGRLATVGSRRYDLLLKKESCMVATEPIEKQGQELSTRACALAVSITNRQQYQEAGEMRQTIKAVIDKAVAHHKPIIDRQTEALKAAKDALKSITEPLEQADRLLKDGRSSWAAEEERKEQEQRRKEDEERRRIAAEKAAELRKQLEEQARLERERIAKEEEARRLAAAEEAEAKGASAAEVDQILDAPPFDMPPSGAMSAEEINAIVESEQAILSTPEPAVRTAPPVRYVYSAECFNRLELVKAIAAGSQPINAVEEHLPTLNRLANAMKEGFNVPGRRLLKRPVDNRRTK